MLSDGLGGGSLLVGSRPVAIVDTICKGIISSRQLHPKRKSTGFVKEEENLLFATAQDWKLRKAVQASRHHGRDHTQFAMVLISKSARQAVVLEFTVISPYTGLLL